MGFRFRRSVKIAPGVRLNVGKKSASVSFGVKGARHTISTTGRRTTSVGIPGSGLYYTTSTSAKGGLSNSNSYNHDAYEVVENFNNGIEAITFLYKDQDYSYQWSSILKKPSPFDPLQKGPNETKAIEKLENYKPSFLEKIFQGKLEKQKEILRNNIETAKIKDKELYEEWEEQKKLAQSILEGDLDAYKKVLQGKDLLGDLKDMANSLDFKILDKNHISVECDINTQEIIPEEYPTVTKTSKLSIRKYTKTNYYELVKLFVCGLTLRMARNIFGLLPFETIVIHIQSNNLNTQTGNIEINTILSVEITRGVLNTLNFDLIDPFDALSNFKHNVKFLKTKGFQPTERIDV